MPKPFWIWILVFRSLRVEALSVPMEAFHRQWDEALVHGMVGMPQIEGTSGI
jgi:hypothetical protein